MRRAPKVLDLLYLLAGLEVRDLIVNWSVSEAMQAPEKASMGRVQ